MAVALTVQQGTAYIDGGSAQSFGFSPGQFSFTPGGVSTRVNLPAALLIQAVQRPQTYDTIVSEIVRGGTVDLETRFHR